MKTFILTALLLSTSIIHAETIKDRIHSIEDGLVKFENGRVAFLNSSNTQLNADDFIEAKLSNDGDLLSFKKLEQPVKLKNSEAFFFPDEPPVFEPTVVASLDEAMSIFNRSNSYYKRISECTDRAHVWAHDEFKKTGTKSKKVFIFFTKSYIDSVRFKWWFHVAPMYSVQTPAGVQELVMDYRFTDRPMTVKEWTEQFVYTKRDCKVTTKFSEYDVNPQTENCYLIFESMHYKTPGEIHAQETSNRFKTTTSESELKAAFNYAFLYQ